MTVSSLSKGSILTGNGYFPRAYPVTKVTIHMMAAVWSAYNCGVWFRDGTRNASSNYGIGNDGEVMCYVEEQNAAWTSSSWENDNRAITIEVSNSLMGGDWPVSDAAYKSLVALCADICRRYGIVPNYNGTPSGSFTEHKMFSATSCPGPWIHERLANGSLIRDVRNAMNGITPEEKEEIRMTLEEIRSAVWGYRGKWKNWAGKVVGADGDANQLLNRAANLWSYRNPKLEKVDAYQILRDIRDGMVRCEALLKDIDKRLG